MYNYIDRMGRETCQAPFGIDCDWENFNGDNRG
jgi:hypothetical protein